MYVCITVAATVLTDCGLSLRTFKAGRISVINQTLAESGHASRTIKSKKKFFDFFRLILFSNLLFISFFSDFQFSRFCEVWFGAADCLFGIILVRSGRHCLCDVVHRGEWSRVRWKGGGGIYSKI